LFFRIDHFKTTGKESVFKVEQKDKAKLVQKFGIENGVLPIVTNSVSPECSKNSKMVNGKGSSMVNGTQTNGDTGLQNGSVTEVNVTPSKHSVSDSPITITIPNTEPSYA